MIRVGVLLRGVILAALVTGLVGAGTEAAAAKKKKAKKPDVAVEVAPNLAEHKVDKVAVLGYVNTAGDRHAEEMADYLVAALTQAGKFRITKADAFARDVERSGVQPGYDRTQLVWKKKRALVRADVDSLLGATSYDALLAFEVTHWKQEKIDFSREGNSTTTVGVKVHLYARDGTLLWKASGLKAAESEPYNPELHVKSTVSGQAVYDETAVPEPPKIEPVAQALAQEVAATLPSIPPAPANGDTQ